MARQLPFSMEAEQSILGAMLIYPKVLEDVRDLDLLKEDFYTESHQRIFDAMMNLYDHGKPIDLTGLITRLNDTAELNQVGGADYLVKLVDTAVSGANAKHYIEMIKNKAHQRKLIETAEMIVQDGFDSAAQLDEIMDRAEKKILEVTRSRRTTDFRSSKEIVREVMEKIQLLRSSEDRVTGIKTGYSKLDRITNGFQRGDLIILAARPSMGKTAFALKRLDYLESIFSDDALIITGRVVRRANVENRIQGSAEYVEYNRQTKAEYINNLRYSFGSKEYINIRFSNMEILKMGKGDSIYSIQIKQDYYSSNYGDTGYLFLLVDASDYKRPVIHVRTWQPKPDPEFGIFGPYNF